MSEQQSEILRTFGQVLATLEHGELDRALADQLQDLIGDLNNAAAAKSGTVKGSISLTLTLTLKDGIVDVTPAIKTKRPEEPRVRTVLWTTPDNRLTRANPNQQQLFRDVNVPSETRTA